MSIISMIAAIDKEGGIGLNNQLLCHLAADLHHFKAITMGKPIIMGRKTFASIGRALPGRLNIVLTQSTITNPDALVFRSLNEALLHLQEYPEILIIGGERLFAEGMDLAERLYITHIHHCFIADVFFPEIKESSWQCINKEFHSSDEKNEFNFTFCTYIKIG